LCARELQCAKGGQKGTRLEGHFEIDRRRLANSGRRCRLECRDRSARQGEAGRLAVVIALLCVAIVIKAAMRYF
jgi:hypothetical protein